MATFAEELPILVKILYFLTTYESSFDNLKYSADHCIPLTSISFYLHHARNSCKLFL